MGFINRRYFSLIFLVFASPNVVSARRGNNLDEVKYGFKELNERVEETTPIAKNSENPTESQAFSEDLTCGCGTSPFPSFEEFSTNWRLRQANPVQRNRELLLETLKPLSPFIIGGTGAYRGEFPWIVAITKYQHKKTPRWRVICGGTLISQQYILTAAHCLDKKFKDTLELVFNVNNPDEISSDPKVIRRKIKQFYIHPGYNSVTIDNDIAVVEMKIPLNLTNEWHRIRPICLHLNSSTLKNAIQSNNGIVAGWGYTTFAGIGSKGENSKSLQKIQVPILSREDCLRTKVPTKNNLTESMFCAGYEEGGTDACVNDSGGPLIVEVGGYHYLRGIVSWGVGCALEGYPGVYTNVSNFIPWIKKTASEPWCQ